MVKRFRIRIPIRNQINAQVRLNEQLPDYADLNIPAIPDIDISIDLEVPSINRFVRPYNSVPTKSMRGALPLAAQPQNWEYIQHRLMDEARAIALNIHPRKTFTANQGNLWEFGSYDSGKKTYSAYTVTWDGSGDPLNVMGVGYGGGNEGGTHAIASLRLSTSTFGEYAPDVFVWAVYFLVNGIPDDSLWFPVPSKNPAWSVGAIVPEYNLSL